MLFNILFAFFSLFSIVLVKPFLDLLFPEKNGAETYLQILDKGEPAFRLSSEWVMEFFNFHLAGLIVHDGKMKALLWVCIGVVLLTVVKNISRYLAMFVIAPIRNGVVRDLRKKLIEKTMELPLSYFSNEKKGDMISRMTADVVEIEWSIMQSLEMVTREPFLILIYVISLIVISAKLTLIIVLLLPIAGLVVALIGKSLKRSAGKAKATLGNLLSVIEETLGALKVIKAFTAEKFVRKKFDEVNQQFFRESNKVYRKTDLASPVSETVMVAVLMLVLYIGCSWAIEGNGMSGSSIILYFVIASQIIPPIKQITIAYTNVQKGIASEERIQKILEAENTVTNQENPQSLTGFTKQIEFENVSFAYQRGDLGYAVKNINLKIEKGKTLALVGQSGSGKTTLADLMPRFYDVSEGCIKIDGCDVRTLDMQNLRSLFGIVTQEAVLFNDTVYNNIAFGIENVSEKDIIQAAKIANAHEFIEKMENGYHTNIGDRGGKLSGGQRQRLSIARAILKNPPILILDEATSALDTESERMVQEALHKLMENRTSIIIAHRLSTVVHADEIVVMQKGEIIERGNHTELLKLNGVYERLYSMQSFK